MAKSKILKDLANGEIEIDKALKRLMLLANDLGNDELATWADKELSGYSKDDVFPNYRFLGKGNVIFSGISGSFKVTRIPLPIQYLDKESRDLLDKPKRVLEPIATIIEKANSKQQLGHDVSVLAQEVYRNSDEFVQCTSIMQVFDHSEFAEIVQKVSQKLLKVFMKLDKEYGNLDELDIGTAGKSKAEIDKTAAEIKQIIYADKVTINNNSLGNATVTNSNIQQGTSGSTQVFNDVKSIVAAIREEIDTYGLDNKNKAEILKLADEVENAEEQNKPGKVKKALLAISGTLKDFAVGVAASVLANKIGKIY